MGQARKTPKDYPRSVLSALLDQARAGLPLLQSCRLAGIRVPTVYGWLASGEEAPEDVQSFRSLYEYAVSERIQTLVDAMAAHAQHDWRAALAELKRHLPEIYGDGVSHADRASLMVWQRRAKAAEAELAETKSAIARQELADRTPRGGSGAE